MLVEGFACGKAAADESDIRIVVATRVLSFIGSRKYSSIHEPAGAPRSRGPARSLGRVAEELQVRIQTGEPSFQVVSRPASWPLVSMWHNYGI